MQEPVTVHFKLSEAEWVSAYRWLFRRNKGFFVSAAFTVAVWVLIFSLLPFVPSHGFSDLTFYAPVFLAAVAYPYYLLSVAPRRYYRGDRKFREGVTFTFTDEFISARGKLMESRADWRLYTDAFEDERMYLLVYGQDLGTLTPIPKRAFQSREQEQAFRALVFPRFARDLAGRRPGDADAAPPGDDYRPASLQPPDWR